MADDRFFDVPRTRVSTSRGAVDLPILYYDVSALHAFFRVEAEKARGALRGTGLKPLLFRRSALAGLAFYDYRKTSIGPYHEVGLALPVYREEEGGGPPSLLLDFLRPSRRRRIAFHVLDLPVTTPAAHAAGREIWGYPKFLTSLPLEWSEGRFSGQVLEPETGRSILRLAGSIGRGWPGPGIDLVLLSRLKGDLVRTVVDVRARMRTSLRSGLVLEVGESDHPMARHLRDLGLEGARPALVQNATSFTSRLNAGARVGRAGDAPATQGREDRSPPC